MTWEELEALFDKAIQQNEIINLMLELSTSGESYQQALQARAGATAE